eukprot:jgi/Tetstr1/461812/TSEL_006894.t1
MDEESRGRTVRNLIRTMSAPESESKSYQQTSGGLTKANMWQHLAEGLLPAYDQPQPGEAAVDQSAPADDMARAGGVLPSALSKQFSQCALTAKATGTGPLANLELPTVEQLAEAIAATISRYINTPPELQHAMWLTETMMAVGVAMQQYLTEPKLLRVGDDNNICANSLGKEDEEFADTLRRAVALTSRPVALLRAVRLRTIVIYLTESELGPSELIMHPFSKTVREAGELGGNTCHNQLRRTTMGKRKKARKTPPASLALRAERRPVYTLTMQLAAHHHNIIGGNRAVDKTE